MPATVISQVPVVPLWQRAKKVYSDPDELRKKVDAFMIAYDKADAEMRRKSKLVEVDADGFTLVKPVSTNTGSTQPTDRRKRKSADAVQSDFYRFQLKERKIAEWSEEKRQETLDKEKLNEMKASRKFQLQN